MATNSASSCGKLGNAASGASSLASSCSFLASSLARGAWNSGRSQRMTPRFSSSARALLRATKRTRISSSERWAGQSYASATAESILVCNSSMTPTQPTSWIARSLSSRRAPTLTFSRTLQLRHREEVVVSDDSFPQRVQFVGQNTDAALLQFRSVRKRQYQEALRLIAWIIAKARRHRGTPPLSAAEKAQCTSPCRSNATRPASSVRSASTSLRSAPPAWKGSPFSTATSATLPGSSVPRRSSTPQA